MQLSADTKKGRARALMRNLPKLNSQSVARGAQLPSLTPSATEWSLSPGPEPHSPPKMGLALGAATYCTFG